MISIKPGTEHFIDIAGANGRWVGEDIMESLRLSANNAGCPTITAPWPAMAHLAQLTQPLRSRDRDPIQSLVSLLARHAIQTGQDVEPHPSQGGQLPP
ncbi:hypothetical protein [Amycolatopsis pithecellobii]|uniref:Uncharacterized protein n=1 Tax=Amycolatopsis pithecellobii TaxID=664692 RepID=A0A6N7Z7H9_9PSEU|nr:hypothetical protein [Amycolatopsis pithecellobii]MTD58139.1 hypothetical protein [Amycolatopsis pithecellobii]